MKKKNDIAQAEIKKLLSDKSSTEPDMFDIDQTEEALINYAKAHSVPPPSGLRDKILSRIAVLAAQKKAQRKIELDNLPPLDDSANWFEWQAVSSDIEPPNDFKNIHLHTLESNEKRELFLAWVKEFVPEEVHHDVEESILILEGNCECRITNDKGETRVIRLGQGDFYTMKPGEIHDIIITSLQPAKAIIEWRKLAA